MKPLLLLLAGLGTASAVTPLAPRPVHVHIGPLAWVHDAQGLPNVQDGRVYVTATHACTLLGSTCTVQNATVRVNGQSVPAPGGRVALKRLTDALALTVTWDARSKVATVALPPRGFAFDALNIVRERLPMPTSATASVTPLRTVLGANLISVFGPRPLTAFTLFTPERGNTLSFRGSLAPGLPDNPSVLPCNGTTCSIALGPDGLSAPFAVAFVQ